jgi:hypothetical protein
LDSQKDLANQIFVSEGSMMRMMGATTGYGIFCCLTLLSGTASAVLTHQYTFNDGSANDSVGTANGTLVGGASLKPDEMAGIVARAGITARARGLAG